MTRPVVTRFAPSPTGDLHIGGARTALFNWLYAKANSGDMLLRIEDTDRERSTAPAVETIIDGLSWLGLEWKGEAVSQHARADRHRQIAEQLIRSGNAYHCYATPEELNEMRETARAEGRPPRYDGRWRDRDPNDAPAGTAPAIRLKTPREGQTIINDQVQGHVVWQNDALDDFIILRANGAPTYMLAVVVDDHDMGVTHIIRGDDHFTNAARQIQLYRALDWEEPVMAHIPLIHGPDNAKLSKRHGALGVEAYRAMGYLPSALLNYLVRLGWSHGDADIMSLEQMIEYFDLSGIGKAPARFDSAKLEHVNGHYIRASDDETLVSAIKDILPYLPTQDRAVSTLDDNQCAKLLAAMPGLKKRASTLVELWHGAAYLFAARPLDMDRQAIAVIADGGKQILSALAPILSQIEEWTEENLEKTLKEFADQKKIKLGKIAQPLRAALTGRSTSPGIFDVLVVLGKNESIARINDQTG